MFKISTYCVNSFYPSYLVPALEFTWAYLCLSLITSEFTVHNFFSVMVFWNNHRKINESNCFVISNLPIILYNNSGSNITTRMVIFNFSTLRQNRPRVYNSPITSLPPWQIAVFFKQLSEKLSNLTVISRLIGCLWINHFVWSTPGLWSGKSTSGISENLKNINILCPTFVIRSYPTFYSHICHCGSILYITVRKSCCPLLTFANQRTVQNSL